MRAVAFVSALAVAVVAVPGASGQVNLTDRLQEACDSAQPLQMRNRTDDPGAVEACNELGRMYQAGQGVAQDVTRAVHFFEKACAAGEMGSCLHLGLMAETGEGVTQDVVKAASSYRKACDGGLADACYSIGVMYYHGTGVPQDATRAAFDLGDNAESRATLEQPLVA